MDNTFVTRKVTAFAVALCVLISHSTVAATSREKAVLVGLAPFTALSSTPAGKVALAANYTISFGIQTGRIRQPTLLPLAEQRQQALRDAFITGGTLAEFSDGLGTTLGDAYQARAHVTSRDGIAGFGASSDFFKTFKNLAPVITYAIRTSLGDAISAKYLFANGTVNGTKKANHDLTNIYRSINGSLDIYGKNYHSLSGTNNDHYGNPRPFQTQQYTHLIIGTDYMGSWASNRTYNQGPSWDLINSPSYPSGHAAIGYVAGILFAIMVPERYQQMITRAAEFGNSRIMVGAHYAMDVVAGRTLALYSMAHLLANDPKYMGDKYSKYLPRMVTIDNFQAALKKASKSLRLKLSDGCGDTISMCAQLDHGRFSDLMKDGAFYATTQTYSLPIVYTVRSKKIVDFNKVAPDAGYLLTAAFPELSLEEANRILTETQAPGGGFLDDGSVFGVYSRINLYAAGGIAQARVRMSKVQ